MVNLLIRRPWRVEELGDKFVSEGGIQNDSHGNVQWLSRLIMGRHERPRTISYFDALTRSGDTLYLHKMLIKGPMKIH